MARALCQWHISDNTIDRLDMICETTRAAVTHRTVDFSITGSSLTGILATSLYPIWGFGVSMLSCRPISILDSELLKPLD